MKELELGSRVNMKFMIISKNPLIRGSSDVGFSVILFLFQPSNEIIKQQKYCLCYCIFRLNQTSNVDVEILYLPYIFGQTGLSKQFGRFAASHQGLHCLPLI